MWVDNNTYIDRILEDLLALTTLIPAGVVVNHEQIAD